MITHEIHSKTPPLPEMDIDYMFYKYRVLMKCHVAIKKVRGISSSNGYNKFSLFIKKRSEIPEYIRDENRGEEYVWVGGGHWVEGRGFVRMVPEML